MTNDPMADFETVELPDPTTAKKKGWTHQVDWLDQGRPCFYCAQSLKEADSWVDAHLKTQRGYRRHYIREIPNDQ